MTSRRNTSSADDAPSSPVEPAPDAMALDPADTRDAGDEERHDERDAGPAARSADTGSTTADPSEIAAQTGHPPAPDADGDGGDGGLTAAFDRVLDRIDTVQRRWAATAFVAAVLRKFSHDRAGQQAALVAYYGFFSVFPLLLAFVSILGFVLEDRDDLRQQIQDAALDEIPLGNLDTDIGSLTGSTFAVVAGVSAALWAGTAAAQAAQAAMNDAWTVPMVDRPNIVFRRLRALGTMSVIGGGIVLSTATGEVLAALPLPTGARLAAFVANWSVNAIVFLLAYQLLVDLPLRWRHLAIGAAVGGAGYQLLQRLGRFYVENLTDSERINTFYGSLAGVIGLLTWLHLLAQVAILSAEVNVVAVRRLWPRSITGRSLTPADRRAFRDDAAIRQYVQGTRIVVTLPGDEPGPAPPDVDDPNGRQGEAATARHGPAQHETAEQDTAGHEPPDDGQRSAGSGDEAPPDEEGDAHRPG